MKRRGYILIQTEINSPDILRSWPPALREETSSFLRMKEGLSCHMRIRARLVYSMVHFILLFLFSKSGLRGLGYLLNVCLVPTYFSLKIPKVQECSSLPFRHGKLICETVLHLNVGTAAVRVMLCRIHGGNPIPLSHQ